MKTPRIVSRLAPRLPDQLTVRQGEVVALRASGLSFGKIAIELHLKKVTVYQHYRYAQAKLVQQALREQGLLPARRAAPRESEPPHR